MEVFRDEKNNFHNKILRINWYLILYQLINNQIHGKTEDYINTHMLNTVGVSDHMLRDTLQTYEIITI